MPILRSTRRIARGELTATAQRLLDASTLCAIATVGPGNRAHINTAYFAWTHDFRIVWLSEPHARHSRNLRTNRSVAVAVFHSGQSWAQPDRGIQLFGSARELGGRAARDAGAAYANRFPAYAETDVAAYRFYRFRPRRVKLFDEPALGTGIFVTARVDADGQMTWERTEVYEASS